MRFDNIPREAWIGLGVLFLLATQDPPLIGLVMLIGFLMIARSMSENSTRDSRRNRQNRRPEVSRDVRRDTRYNNDYPAQRQTPPRREYADDADTLIEPEVDTDPVYEAIATAGHDPESLKVLPVDLGLLVYKDNRQEIYRAQSVPDDVDYVRPFVELQLPANVSGKIRFELLDSNGQSLFVDEAGYQLKKGRQPIVASTWLPVHDAHDLGGMWQLRISADGVLLANHVFEWDTEPEPAAIREHIQEDGEISPELRAALAENRLQKMSLDELLAGQEEEDAVQPPAQASQQARSQRR